MNIERWLKEPLLAAEGLLTEEETKSLMSKHQDKWFKAPERAYNETLGLQEGDSTTFYQSRLELIREVCNNMEQKR